MFKREDAAEIILIGHHHIEEVAQILGAFFRCFGSPFRLRGFGSLNGSFGFGLAAISDFGNQFAVCRVIDVESRAVCCVSPFAVDIGFRAQKCRIGKLVVRHP